MVWDIFCNFLNFLIICILFGALSHPQKCGGAEYTFPSTPKNGVKISEKTPFLNVLCDYIGF